MSRDEHSNDRQFAFGRVTAPSPLQVIAKLRPPPKTRPPTTRLPTTRLPLHRPLVVTARRFWPERGQFGLCTLLAAFDLALLAILIWNVWGRR